MQNPKLGSKFYRFICLVAVTSVFIPYQNCARLPQYSAGLQTGDASSLSETDKISLGILARDCNSCHGSSSAGLGGFKTSDNLSAMIGGNLIKPGSADQSPVYTRINDGSMPQGIPFSVGDKTTIKNWIDGMNGSPVPGPSGTVPTTTMPAAALQPTFASLNAGVFQSQCVGCHNSANAAGGYNMATYAGVITRATAGNGAASPLYIRMTSAAAPMPTGGLLPAATAAVVKAWIDAGRLNN